jgi:hypothetical protein
VGAEWLPVRWTFPCIRFHAHTASMRCIDPAAVGSVSTRSVRRLWTSLS